MESRAPRSGELNTLSDARMRWTTHTESLPRALFAGEITYMDVYSASKHDLPVGLNGERAGMRYAVLFVDAFSRFKRVYLVKSESELPGLARHYLSELGHSVHAGGHFLLEAGCRRYMQTDGGLAMNSERFARVLMDFGLAANATSCPHTPASNGVAERTFGTIGPDMRAALAMSVIGFKHWHWAFRAALAARNKLATQRVVDAETGAVVWKTPFELFYHRRPSLKHACVFGAPCRVLLLGEQRPKGKFSPHTVRGKVLGRGEDGVQLGKVYRYLLGWVILIEDGRIAYSRHVVIDERGFLEGGHTPFHKTIGPARDAELEAAAANERRAAATEAAERANEPRAGPAGPTGITGSHEEDTYLTQGEE
jgi:hypothetical protein